MNIISGKNLFLTGGTGFFGKALLRHWKSTGSPFDKIFILSRNPKSFLKDHLDLIAELNVKFIKGDILEASKITLNENIDYVIHAATDSTIGPSLGRLEVFNQIVKGTEEVLKFAVNHHCKRFLFTSSGAVYGPQPHEMEKITEDYLGAPNPLNPNSAYGMGKKTAEHLCALYSEQHGLNYMIARCFAFVGEDLPLGAHFAIGNFIRDAMFNDNIFINGDGMTLRSYMDQRDLSNWLINLLFNARCGQAYNVGSDKKISIEELAFTVQKIISPNKNVIKQTASSQTKTRNTYIPDINKAYTELNLSCRYDLEESITYIMERKKI